MLTSQIDPRWPNALRWLLVQGLRHLTPWHLIQTREDFAFAAKAFELEDSGRGQVFVFARRQDRDDFAGLEIRDGAVTDRVICFHPVFSSAKTERPGSWNIVLESFDDVFDFLSKRVVADMKGWALEEDASDYQGDA